MAAWGGMDAREETAFEYRYTPYSFGIIDAATAAEHGYDQISPTPGWLSKGETFEELAEAAGIDKRNFVNTMARWQEDRRQRRHRHRVRARGESCPWARAPYYAVKVCQFHQTTVGGISVNEKAQVNAAIGGIIPRLYATSTAASIGGIVYPSSGWVDRPRHGVRLHRRGRRLLPRQLGVIQRLSNRRKDLLGKGARRGQCPHRAPLSSRRLRQCGGR